MSTSLRPQTKNIQTIMRRILILALGSLAIFSSCQKEDNGKNGIFKGPEVQVHHGKAWTWVELSKSRTPVRMAVTLNDAALNSVPVAGEEAEGGHDHSDMENNWVLKFHPQANVTVFNHVGMGWNPAGHEPEPIYGRPHFDFHFYFMTPEEVAAIPPYNMAAAKFDNWPSSQYFPSLYFNPGGGVPQMGTHWIDPTSGEFNGQIFGQTFIYGSYDGKVTFYEPMITLEFLKSNSNFGRAIPQPAKVQKTGWYPTRMRVVKHDGLTDIIYDDFTYRTES
jgi:hypothetical protein